MTAGIGRLGLTTKHKCGTGRGARAATTRSRAWFPRSRTRATDCWRARRAMLRAAAVASVARSLARAAWSRTRLAAFLPARFARRGADRVPSAGSADSMRSSFRVFRDLRAACFRADTFLSAFRWPLPLPPVPWTGIDRSRPLSGALGIRWIDPPDTARPRRAPSIPASGNGEPALDPDRGSARSEVPASAPQPGRRSLKRAPANEGRPYPRGSAHGFFFRFPPGPRSRIPTRLRPTRPGIPRPRG